MKSDSELLYYIRTRDDECFEQLIERYHDMICYLIHVYRGITEAHCDFDELYQVAIITLYQAALTYREDKKTEFKTYLNQSIIFALKNQRRDCFRKKKCLNYQSYSLDEEVEEDSGLYAVDCLENREPSIDPVWTATYHYFEKCRNDMFFDKQEEIIWNLWVDGYTYDEIAEQMNCSKKYVDNKIQRTKRKMELLKRKFDE